MVDTGLCHHAHVLVHLVAQVIYLLLQQGDGPHVLVKLVFSHLPSNRYRSDGRRFPYGKYEKSLTTGRLSQLGPNQRENITLVLLKYFQLPIVMSPCSMTAGDFTPDLLKLFPGTLVGELRDIIHALAPGLLSSPRHFGGSLDGG